MRATAALPALRAQPRRLSLAVAMAALPLAALVAYVAVMVARAPVLSDASFTFADAPEAAYLGQGLGHATVTLPLHTEIAPTAVEGALLSTVGHVGVQLLGPCLAIAALVVILATLRGLRLAWIPTAVAGLAAGPLVLSTVLWPTSHVLALLGMAALAFATMRMARGGASRAAIVAATCVAGVALVGVQGFALYAIVPLLLACTTTARMCAAAHVLRTGLRMALACVALAVLGHILLRLMGVNILLASVAGADAFGVAGIGAGIVAALHSFAWMVSGGWYGTQLAAPLEAIALVAGAAVPLAAPAALVLTLRRGREPATLAYAVFWASADALVLIAFVLLGLGSTPQAGHYLIPCWLSALATLPLLPRGARSAITVRLAAACAAVCATFGVATLAPASLSGFRAPTDHTRILSVLQSQHLTRGYADYWTSHPLTWLSGEQVHVYPVVDRCATPASLCPYTFAASSWYQPQAGRTFLIVRHDFGCLGHEPPALLGTPERTIAVDGDVSILVYADDIARTFSAPAPGGCVG